MITTATDGATPQVCVVCRLKQTVDQFLALRDPHRSVTTCLTCRRAKQQSEATSRRSIQLMQDAAAGRLLGMNTQPVAGLITFVADGPAPQNAVDGSSANMYQLDGSASTDDPAPAATGPKPVALPQQNLTEPQHDEENSQSSQLRELKPRDQWQAGSDATLLAPHGGGLAPVPMPPVPTPAPPRRGRPPLPRPTGSQPPRKRGRPPLPMPSVSPPPPRRRGRPPLPRPSVSPPPVRRRGRPPLPMPSVSPSPPRKRGRPPIQGPRLPPPPPRRRGRPPTQGPRLPPRPRGRPPGSRNRVKPPQPSGDSERSSAS
ncbi:hypothetical protein F4861DRAFT_485623 [Xylaria intraflava]|nr:hypothetical protein F4861DRAFT_485623 [Xylaria intraflava]